MTEAKTETEYPNYIFEERKYQEKGEFEVPARLLDLLISFYESSTKPEYSWNNPPYRKITRDGSYWQVVVRSNVKIQVKDEIKEEDAVCVFLAGWTSGGEVCLFPNDLLVLNVRFGAVFREMWSNGWKTEVVLKSKHRDQTLELFDVYRKLLFYKNLISTS